MPEAQSGLLGRMVDISCNERRHECARHSRVVVGSTKPIHPFVAESAHDECALGVLMQDAHAVSSADSLDGIEEGVYSWMFPQFEGVPVWRYDPPLHASLLGLLVR
jgi:hypothetical protein